MDVFYQYNGCGLVQLLALRTWTKTLNKTEYRKFVEAIAAMLCKLKPKKEE
jgi:hypothetical protein